MPFETFSKSLVALRRDPQLTIQTRGTLTLNAAAYAALGEPRAVELLYDRAQRVLGLRPVPPDVAHAMAVRSPSTTAGGPYVVSAMAFLRHYGIDTSEARRWIVHIEDGIARIDLASAPQRVGKSAHPPAPSRRPRPRRTS
jgi:hypothetical protein